MARAPGVTRTGTAKDLADRAVGYVSSGESMWSRNAASPGNIKLAGYQGNIRKVRGPKSNEELIAEATKALAKLQRDVRAETNPVRLAKLRKNFEIKTRFIARLTSEGR
jgi:hypothetical protein